MATRLKGLVLDRIDLVDAPANPGSRVVLVKRDTNAAEKNKTGNPNAAAGGQPGELKRSGTVAKQKLSKMDVLKALVAMVFKGDEAGMPGEVADWAEGGGSGDGEPAAKPAEPVKESAALTSMKVHHADLGKAIDAMGDCSKMPADHPVHALKALHTQLGNDIAAKAAEEASAAPAAPAEGEPGGEGVEMSVNEPYGPQTGQPGVGKMFRLLTRGVDKRFEIVKADLAKANDRADRAEKIAKQERDARELDGVKVELRKFDKLGIDVEKEAPKYLVLKQAGEAVYQHALEVLKGTQAQIAKADSLMQELGASGDGMVGGSGEKAAYAACEAAAAKLMDGVAKGASGKLLTPQQAIAKVFEMKTPEHKNLVNAYYMAQKGGPSAAAVQ